MRGCSFTVFISAESLGCLLKFRVTPIALAYRSASKKHVNMMSIHVICKMKTISITIMKIINGKHSEQ